QRRPSPPTGFERHIPATGATPGRQTRTNKRSLKRAMLAAPKALNAALASRRVEPRPTEPGRTRTPEGNEATIGWVLKSGYAFAVAGFRAGGGRGAPRRDEPSPRPRTQLRRHLPLRPVRQDSGCEAPYGDHQRPEGERGGMATSLRARSERRLA